MSEFYARIRPGNNVKRYALRNKIFYAVKGWYKVSRSFAEELSKQPLNILNPSSGPSVFEVKTRKQARAIETREIEKVAPAGTVDEPITTHDEVAEGVGDMTSDGMAVGSADTGADTDADEDSIPGLEDASFDDDTASQSVSAPVPVKKKVAKKVAKKRAKKRVKKVVKKR